jgi:hypothetical protein
MPSASQPQNRKSKLWAINPRKQIRRKPARNKPKPAAPPHRRRRLWSASRLPARKSNRLSSAVSLGFKIWGDGFFSPHSPKVDFNGRIRRAFLLRSKMNDSALNGHGDRFGPVGHGKFAQNVFQVPLDGVFTDF